MPDGRVHRHRKLHAFEHDAIRSGDDTPSSTCRSGCRAGVLICYDCNLVENVRATALLGAEILLAPHQTGGCRSKNPHLMGAIDRRLWDNRSADPAAIERELRGDKGRGWLMRWLPSRAHDNGMFLDLQQRRRRGRRRDPHRQRDDPRPLRHAFSPRRARPADDMVIADLDRSLVAVEHRPQMDQGAAARALRRPDGAHRQRADRPRAEVRRVMFTALSLHFRRRRMRRFLREFPITARDRAFSTSEARPIVGS